MRNRLPKSARAASDCCSRSTNFIKPMLPETSGGCWRPMTTTWSGGAAGLSVKARMGRPPALRPICCTGTPASIATRVDQASSSSMPIIWLLAMKMGSGTIDTLMVHSRAPGSPVHCESGAMAQRRPSRLAHARGRALAVAMASRSVTSHGLDERRRNAYQGLGLIGSRSGATTSRNSRGPTCSQPFRRAPENRLSMQTCTPEPASKVQTRRSWISTVEPVPANDSSAGRGEPDANGTATAALTMTDNAASAASAVSHRNDAPDKRGMVAA